MGKGSKKKNKWKREIGNAEVGRGKHKTKEKRNKESENWKWKKVNIKKQIGKRHAGKNIEK